MSQIAINNIRLGFATNSSSSHSIIVLPQGVQGPRGRQEDSNQGNYGWDDFVLADPSSKLDYLAAMVGWQIRDRYGDDIATAVMKEWFAGVEWDDGWFVDHQSVWKIPNAAGTGQISKAFLADVQAFLAREDVLVLGGNDNDGMPDEFLELKQYAHDVHRLDENGNLYAKRTGQWWTVFNADTGAKLRLSFAPNPTPFVRGTSPELVDMKITDYCPFGCDYCYQDSTPSGKAASLTIIFQYLDAMQRSGVFEVALGGGEPTMHPEFTRILEACRERHIVPNLTTKVMPEKWSHEVRDAILRYAGAVAVSISQSANIPVLRAFRALYGKPLVAHYVVGVQSDFELKCVIQSCRESFIPLTLLGFKDTGRGQNYNRPRVAVSADTLRSAGRLSVDTSFIKHYGEVLKEANVPDVLLVPGEGVTSMYIDAVAQKAGRSSYEPETMVEFKNPYPDLSKVWDQIGG